jgi:predicted PurR-regulated permease PerM
MYHSRRLSWLGRCLSMRSFSHGFEIPSGQSRTTRHLPCGPVIQSRVMGSVNTIAAWVGIVGFILLYPMGVLINITSPKIVTWWAKTSDSRRQSRIKRIETQLPDLTSDAEGFERAVYTVARYSFNAIVAALFMIVNAMGDFYLGLTRNQYPAAASVVETVLTLFCCAVFLFYHAKSLDAFGTLDPKLRHIRRRQLSQELEKLQQKT